MQVIKGHEITTDSWTRLEAGDLDNALPDGDLIVPLSFWRSAREQLLEREGRVAICLNGEDEIDEIKDDLSNFELIAIEFPVFRDGRGYSLARALRQRYGYEGDIRAVGDVLRDQLFFMQRCGITSYVIKEGKDWQDALRGFSDFSVRYQGATDGIDPIYRQRQA